jgi:hypothetical protein
MKVAAINADQSFSHRMGASRFGDYAHRPRRCRSSSALLGPRRGEAPRCSPAKLSSRRSSGVAERQETRPVCNVSAARAAMRKPSAPALMRNLSAQCRGGE